MAGGLIFVASLGFFVWGLVSGYNDSRRFAVDES